MLQIEERHAIEEPWISMPPLRLGSIPTGLGTPDLYLKISEHDRLLLRVDLYGGVVFRSDAVAWGECVFVGWGQDAYAIDPTGKTASKVPLESYFDKFYVADNCLLIACGAFLLRFSPTGALLWKSPGLGLDGVVVHGVENNLIKGEGEWDPPGGWRPFILQLDSGGIVENGGNEKMNATPLNHAPAAGETFKASRWTRGNLLFPTRIVVSPLHVSRVKPRLFGTTDESIAISQVASVQIRTGIIWSEIRIDSTGGADPITSHGHRKRDAIRIRELIETYQAARTPAGN